MRWRLRCRSPEAFHQILPLEDRLPLKNQKIRNVGLCLCRPVKKKTLILEFKSDLELGLGLKLE